MERLQRINSSFDLEYDYYRKNLPAIEDSEDTEESIDLYEKIFESRNTFTVLGLDSYIILNKKSLNKIASMIKAFPQEYVLFTNHQVIEEDKFDKLLEKESDQLNPIFIAEPENENDEIEDDKLKKDKNLENDLINNETFKLCLWLYLFLLFCSICNFLFLVYIAVKTNIGFSFFTIYIFILFTLLLITGIYGFIKCIILDFSGYLLKCFTFCIPFAGSISIIVFFINNISFNVFWMKLIVDIITIIIGIILILYLTGLIKLKKKYIENDQKEGLLKEEDSKN